MRFPCVNLMLPAGFFVIPHNIPCSVSNCVVFCVIEFIFIRKCQCRQKPVLSQYLTSQSSSLSSSPSSEVSPVPAAISPQKTVFLPALLPGNLSSCQPIFSLSFTQIKGFLPGQEPKPGTLSLINLKACAWRNRQDLSPPCSLPFLQKYPEKRLPVAL